VYPKCISQIYKVCDDELQLVANLFGNFHNEYGISTKMEISYKIIRKIDNEIVGNCTLNFSSNKNDYCLGNVSLSILPQYEGNEYGYKTIKLLGQVALNLKVKKLNISTLPDDVEDIQLFEKLGARFIGIVKIPRKTSLKLTKETLNNLKKQKVKKLVMYEWKIEGDK